MAATSPDLRLNGIGHAARARAAVWSGHLTPRDAGGMRVWGHVATATRLFVLRFHATAQVPAFHDGANAHEPPHEDSP